MSEVFYCQVCNTEMKFKERVPSKKKYRIRRFACPRCGFQETIFAGGKIDHEIAPGQAIRDANKLYAMEERIYKPETDTE
jgi:hypothetical protein